MLTATLQPPARKLATLSPETAEKLQRAKDAIDSSDRPYRVRCCELAMAAGMQQARFSTLFRQQFGETPKETIARRELTVGAAALLTYSSIAAVSKVLGFGDQTNFANRWRHLTGKSPSEWRKEQKVPANERSTEQATAPSSSDPYPANLRPGRDEAPVFGPTPSPAGRAVSPVTRR